LTSVFGEQTAQACENAWFRQLPLRLCGLHPDFGTKMFSAATREALLVKTLMVLLLLSPASFSQSPFDGTWVTTPPLAQEPAVYLLAKGLFRCSGCMANMEVEADGNDHKVAETAYWDTLNAQMVNAHTVEIIAKKAGKTMLTEVDAISPDGSTLTQLVKQRPLRLKQAIDESRKGLMVLIPFPVRGVPKKRIDPETVR
jgi:hypothetical protein